MLGKKLRNKFNIVFVVYEEDNYKISGAEISSQFGT
jgi:hypothetical protein